MQQRIGEIEIISISYLNDAPRTTPRHPEQFGAPRTPVQETIAEIWREILGQDAIGITDNFFEIGGDSLQAGQVLARAREVFHVEPPLREMFETATIAGMAEKIETALHRLDCVDHCGVGVDRGVLDGQRLVSIEEPVDRIVAPLQGTAQADALHARLERDALRHLADLRARHAGQLRELGL